MAALHDALRQMTIMFDDIWSEDGQVIVGTKAMVIPSAAAETIYVEIRPEVEFQADLDDLMGRVAKVIGARKS